MAFVREKILEKDRELYNSLKMYDYDHEYTTIWGSTKHWVVDREREIYFTHISGGVLEHPKQYTLVWNGDKIVVFLHARVSVIRDENGRELYMEPHWNIIQIRVPIKLMEKSEEIIELVKEVAIAENSKHFKLDYIPSAPDFFEEVN